MAKKILKGNIIHTPTREKFEFIENGYIIVSDSGKIEKVTKDLPDEFANYPIANYGNKLIIPSFVDLHIHSGQYPNRGLCLDLPLLDWLLECTYPMEAKFKDLEFAKNAYACFIKELWKGGNLRSVVYDTVYYKSTNLLANMFITSGMCAVIGKACMDINTPDYIVEDTKQSLIDTEKFIIETLNKSKLVTPAVYPRFVPACSRELLRGLGDLAIKYQVPVISHLSESLLEIKVVKEQYPEFSNYAEVYNHFNLFGQTPTVMAHAVHSNLAERRLIKENGVWIAHSPLSNFNLISGLMVARLFLNEDIKLGLGSDIGASANISIIRSMYSAIATSKIVSMFSVEELKPLTTPEVFYLGTKGGGTFFGKVGSFEEGYEFDALVVDDSSLLDLDYTLEERIQRFIYLGEDEFIKTRFLAGREIPEPIF